MKHDELVKRLRSGCDSNTAFLLCYKAADALVALQTELAAARADAARLEWLAQHPLEGTIRIGGDLKPCTFWGVSSAGTDLRAAIDAALAAPEKP